MLTRTINPITDQIDSPEFIEEKVNERGFYLYEWISPEELRMSILADYLTMIRTASMPLAIITLIAGLIGLAWEITGVILAIFGVLSVFYLFVGLTLIFRAIKKSYLYTRGGSVVITDDHYVSAGEVVERDNFAKQKEAFSELEKTFREPLLEPSGLAEHIEIQKSSVLEQLKMLAQGGGDIMKNLGRSRETGGIIAVLIIGGFLYGGMMAAVYFIGVFFVALLARIFSWFAGRILLAVNNTEYEIQTRFGEIFEASMALKDEKKRSIALLTEAGRNAWIDNLSGKIDESFKVLNEAAHSATENTLELREILENSKYKDIFNFTKYGNWIKTQVLVPIEEIHELLTSNRKTITTTIDQLTQQISKTHNPSLQKPLILQRDRLDIHIQSLDRMIEILTEYRTKLAIKP